MPISGRTVMTILRSVEASGCALPLSANRISTRSPGFARMSAGSMAIANVRPSSSGSENFMWTQAGLFKILLRDVTIHVDPGILLDEHAFNCTYVCTAAQFRSPGISLDEYDCGH